MSDQNSNSATRDIVKKEGKKDRTKVIKREFTAEVKQNSRSVLGKRVFTWRSTINGQVKQEGYDSSDYSSSNLEDYSSEVFESESNVKEESHSNVVEESHPNVKLESLQGETGIQVPQQERQMQEQDQMRTAIRPL